jgi:hypothetical protein
MSAGPASGRQEITISGWMVALMATYAPVITAVIVVAAVQAFRRGPLGAAVVETILFYLPLFAFTVVPCLWGLWRRARAIPLVTIDQQGLVFGSDRHRDPAIDWQDVERVAVRHLGGFGYSTWIRFQVFLVYAKADHAAMRGRGRSTRLAGKVLGSPYAISSLFASWSDAQIREMLQSHLPGVPVVDEPRR